MNNIEIIQISDTEFWLGKDKTFLIKGNIIYVIAIEEQSAEIAIKHKEICEMLSSRVEGKVNYLIDLNKTGKNSPEARIIWKQISENAKTNKVATFGLNPVARVIASFVIGIGKQGNIRFFKTKNEALKWLSI